MEPKMGGRRVGRPFRNTASNNISPAPSPTPPRSARNKKQPAKKLKTAEVDLAQNYAVKRILDEEERDGVTHYEIDWENDPKTGKPFPTSWVRFPTLLPRTIILTDLFHRNPTIM